MVVKCYQHKQKNMLVKICVEKWCVDRDQLSTEGLNQNKYRCAQSFFSLKHLHGSLHADNVAATKCYFWQVFLRDWHSWVGSSLTYILKSGVHMTFHRLIICSNRNLTLDNPLIFMNKGVVKSTSDIILLRLRNQGFSFRLHLNPHQELSTRSVYLPWQMECK